MAYDTENKMKEQSQKILITKSMGAAIHHLRGNFSGSALHEMKIDHPGEGINQKNTTNRNYPDGALHRFAPSVLVANSRRFKPTR
jgi:hypothetical protein